MEFVHEAKLCYIFYYPKFIDKKNYIVKLANKIDTNSIDLWRSGVNLDGRDTLSCVVKIVSINSQRTV